METASDDEREIRAARNQALFRAVNEQMRRVNEVFSELTDAFAITCECYDNRCIGMLTIRPAAYETVRSHPRRFAVLPGHVLPEVEEVVEESDAYVIVEKVRVAAEVAGVLDPRAV